MCLNFFHSFFITKSLEVNKCIGCALNSSTLYLSASEKKGDKLKDLELTNTLSVQALACVPCLVTTRLNLEILMAPVQ